MKADRQIARDARQLWRLCFVDGSLDEGRARQVVDQLMASGHSRAPAVASQLLRLVKLGIARKTAQVASAAELDETARASIRDGLMRKYGRDLSITFAVDPPLIGGLRVTVGDDVYDGSVRGALAALDTRFSQNGSRISDSESEPRSGSDRRGTGEVHP